MKKVHLSQEDFSRMAHQLCSQIVPVRHKIDWIVGIERGGIPLSTWLAYALGKKHDKIRIQFRKDEMIALPHSSYVGPEQFKFDGQFLLVDDIVDSGRTIKKFREITNYTDGHFWVASLHWCPENSPDCKPDFYVKTKEKDEWIVYPWEKDYEVDS